MIALANSYLACDESEQKEYGPVQWDRTRMLAERRLAESSDQNMLESFGTVMDSRLAGRPRGKATEVGNDVT
jgi:hypothetical protein